MQYGIKSHLQPYLGGWHTTQVLRPSYWSPETGDQKLVSTFCTPDARNWYQKDGVYNFIA